MPDYLTVEDFLTYDAQLTRKMGRMGEDMSVVKQQVNRLHTAFTAYVSETDAYRIPASNRIDSIDNRLDGVDRWLDGLDIRLEKLEQAINNGFALIFAHLGIQP